MNMRKSAGFTLMEILVVISILGFLFGFLIPTVMKQMGRADDKKIELKMNSLKQALVDYKMDIGNYPSTKDGLKALLENPRPNDPRYSAQKNKWPYVSNSSDIEDNNGNEFIYHCPPEKFKGQYKSFEIIWEEGDEVKYHTGA
ncbi:MAG: General secretion pathway protein G [candidate division TM6 bacterium GW2011_GWF2_38_10]|nr:MAG: General secretion pathway protein G [candidate division TM6 bacterium GW2011_GWF2_38_10]